MTEGRAGDRREFLTQAGRVAWATPLILTLTAGRAGALAVSCAPAATPCGTWSTPLSACLPLVTPVVCCSDCERGPNEDPFCFCVGP